YCARHGVYDAYPAWFAY
nr:immunoglobulin heavy chain junction region [Mus musculus]